MEASFTKAIFWDTDVAKLDLERHRAYIMERVLNYGTLDDWKLLKRTYGSEKILLEAKNIRDLHPKTLNFLSKYFHVPKNEFRCYRLAQSIQAHSPY